MSLLAPDILEEARGLPVAVIIAGLVLGLLLLRLWTMALTSCGGALLVAYSSLCLLDRFAKLNVVALAEGQTVWLNWMCAGLTLTGMLVQFLLERRRNRPAAKAKPRPAPR